MDILTEWLIAHPKVMAWIMIFVMAKVIFSMIVDALLTVRAEIDKTPETADTPFEKFVEGMRLFGVFLSKLAANFAGFKGTRSVKSQVNEIAGKGDGK